MQPKTSLRVALEDKRLLGAALDGPSWDTWRAILLSAMGEKLKPNEVGAFRRLTKRQLPPNKMVEEFLGVVGRRGGKSRAIAVLACYIASLCVHKLVPGETGIVMCIAPDQKQARVVRNY